MKRRTITVVDFEKGDIIKCIDAFFYTTIYITHGKEYEVQEVSLNGDPRIINDRKKEAFYNKKRFDFVR